MNKIGGARSFRALPSARAFTLRAGPVVRRFAYQSLMQEPSRMIDQSPPGSWAAILPYCTLITVREDDSLSAI